MKHIIILTLCALFFGSVQAQKTVINDPNVELRTVKPFHAIEVSSAIDLYLSAGDQQTVAVSAKETKWRDLIRTEVTPDGVLKIYLESNSWRWNSGSKKLKAYVAFTTLERLKASGASDVFVDGVITGDKLELDLSGASDFKGAVKLNELRIEQSGASDIHITGSVNGLTTVHTVGASDLKGYDLTTQDCEAHASGASDIRITVSKTLNAKASGASSIYYKGEAVIKDLQSSGASSVSRKS